MIISNNFIDKLIYNPITNMDLFLSKLHVYAWNFVENNVLPLMSIEGLKG